MIYDHWFYVTMLCTHVYSCLGLIMCNDVIMCDDVIVKALSNNGRPNKPSLPAHNSPRRRPRRSYPMCANDQLGLCLWVFTCNQLGLAIFKKSDRWLSGTSNRRTLFETRRRRTAVLKPTTSVCHTKWTLTNISVSIKLPNYRNRQTSSTATRHSTQEPKG